jgi:hypothetical protein
MALHFLSFFLIMKGTGTRKYEGRAGVQVLIVKKGLSREAYATIQNPVWMEYTDGKIRDIDKVYAEERFVGK